MTGDHAQQVAHSQEVGRRANELWEAGDVLGWLSLFRDDAHFWVPGEASISGDHTKEAFAPILERLMSAGSEGSGRWVIEQYASPMGTSNLMEQKVAVEGPEILYHAMDCYEWRPDDFTKFAVWMLFAHEYPRFAEAWGERP